MRIHHRIMAASIVVLATSCSSSSGYVYDPYYGYYPVAYDDAYYDAAMMGGYYYYPDYYFYGQRFLAATSTTVVPPSVRLLLARWNAAFDESCITATPSDDKDGDGISVNSTVTFACSSNVDGVASEVTGAVTERDVDDNAKDAGFELVFAALRARVVGAGGAVTERVLDGSEKVVKGGAGLALSRDLTVSATDTFPDAVERRSTLRMTTQGAFTPEVTPGSALVTKGTLTLSGQGTFTGADGVVITLTRQTDPSLHWNGDCAKQPNGQGYDAGAIIYRSSQGRQSRIVHDSCTTVSVTNSEVPTP